jgi:aminopeptidase N
MEAAFREKMYGRDDYLRKIVEDRETYFAGEAKMNRRRGLYNQFAGAEDSIFDPVTYQKGSAVIHTLRETIGDRIFWKAINVYLNKHKFANVETRDLQDVFEDVSKKDLNWFFDQWVYAAGYPKLEIRQQYFGDTKKLKLTVSQTQKAEGSTPTSFILPLEVEITTPTGVLNEKIKISKRREDFTFDLTAAPTKVVYDKDLKIPLKSERIREIN